MSKVNLISTSIHNPPAALMSQDNQVYFLVKDLNVIGRSENSLICLTDKQISRIHCYIEKSKDNVFKIRDVSVHGTFVNGVQLVKQNLQELHHGDEISLSNSKTHTFVFLLNKKYSVSHDDESEDLNFRLKEERMGLNNSHLYEMEKLTQEMSDVKTRKPALQEEMNTRLMAQENLLKQEQENLSNSINKQSSKEEKDHVERKLKEMEENHKSEIEKMERDIKSKMNNIVQKEQELQELKREMELRHKMEIDELEVRYKAKVEELKGKLAISEKEQWRLLGETREVEQKWEETKQILHECEIEQARISKEKEEVETKLESKIKDLAEERIRKCQLVKDYEKQLQKKEEDEIKQKKEIENLEEDLQCSICAEVFIETAVLNCGHMFCKTCNEEWKTKKKRICPMCRTKITSTVRVLNIDSIIEKNVALMSTEAKERREIIIRERRGDKSESPLPAKKRKYNHSTRITLRPHHFQRIRSPVIVSPPPVFHRVNMEDNLLSLDSPFLEQGDPFVWHTRQNRVRRSRRTETRTLNDTVDLVYQDLPVTVAPIHLTNIPVRHLSHPATHNTTSTTENSLIDLTTP